MTSYQRWTLLTTLLVACLCCVLASKCEKSNAKKVSKYVTITGSNDGESMTVMYKPNHKKALDIKDYTISYVRSDGIVNKYTFGEQQILAGSSITVYARTTSLTGSSLMIASDISSFDSSLGTIYFRNNQDEIVAKYPE